jgi:small Trp-rich protein
MASFEVPLNDKQALILPAQGPRHTVGPSGLEVTVGFVALGLIFIGLKMAEVGFMQTVSWWWICAPGSAAIVWWHIADTYGYTKRKEVEKMDLKKERRRQKLFAALGQTDPLKKKK